MPTRKQSTKSLITTTCRRSKRYLADALALMPTVKFVVPRKSRQDRHECAFCGGNATREIYGGWSLEHLPGCPLLRGVPDCEPYQP